jgi:phospholipase C
LLPFFFVSFAKAQIQPNAFQHIIIVIQENRTPDNIFGYWATSGGPNNCTLLPPSQQFTGADLANGGSGGPPCNVTQPMNNGGGTTGFDPGHQYEDWYSDYDGGAMDGFCHEYTSAQCDSAPSPYSYINTGDVDPYYSIATTYGFAN